MNNGDIVLSINGKSINGKSRTIMCRKLEISEQDYEDLVAKPSLQCRSAHFDTETSHSEGNSTDH